MSSEFFDYDALDEALGTAHVMEDDPPLDYGDALQVGDDSASCPRPDKVQADWDTRRGSKELWAELLESPDGIVVESGEEAVDEKPLVTPTVDSSQEQMEGLGRRRPQRYLVRDSTPEVVHFEDDYPINYDPEPEAEDMGSSGSTSSSDDGLSELWPGDTDYLSEAMCDQTPGTEHSVVNGDAHSSATQASGMQLQSESAEDGNDCVFAWEVVYSRIVVRSAPSFDAPPLGFASKRELFFAEPEETSNEHWVKLSKERGYILKDGRQRDPKLSLLIQPFHIDLEVPAHHQQEVLRLMRDAWVKFRIASKNYLKPLIIEKLRKCCEDAIKKSCGEFLDAFDVGAFKDELLPEVDKMLELMLGPATVSNGYPTLQAQVNQAIVFGASANGDGVARAWRHDAPHGFRAGGEVTTSYALQLLESMRRRSLPCAEDALHIVTKAANLLADEASLVELSVPPGATLHVVGDLHGQYWDLLNIIDLHGSPSRDNWFLFNGDFVDRGQFSVEVVLGLFALKAAFPSNVHLNRGNHEAARMNVHYGFMNEAKLKYSGDVFIRFVQAFKTLPLAHIVNKSVLVVHGGLPRQDGVRLDDIKLLDRKREPDDNAQDLMIDLLWSDPMERLGRDRSPRGAGTLFGPDVTEQFCQENGLTCVIRSHEMKDEGFEWHHNEMCLTIFSAANYCDICGNFGAVCNLTPQGNPPTISRTDIAVQKFEASPHPNERLPQPQGVFQLVQ